MPAVARFGILFIFQNGSKKNLTSEQQEILKETFAFFDKNKDGQVNIEFSKISLALLLFFTD